MQLVSIIIPNYNHVNFLRQRIDSVLKQTFQNFELILLDDNSTDGSKELLESYADHSKVSHVVLNSTNSGSPFLQWERGLKLAKGQFIWIAESDDYSDKAFLEEMVDLHRRYPDISLAYCQSYKVDKESNIQGSWLDYGNFNSSYFDSDFFMKGNEFIENFLFYRNVIPNVSAVLFNKEKLSKIRPLEFFSFFKYNADWYYYLQLLCNSNIAFKAKSLNYFREHDSSVIGKALTEKKQNEIFLLELRGRRQMLSYIQDFRPDNIHKINLIAKREIESLRYQLSKALAKNGKIIKAFYYVWNKPRWYKKVIKNYLR